MMESLLNPESLKILERLQWRVYRLRTLSRLLVYVEAFLMFVVSIYLALGIGIALQIYVSPPRWVSIGVFLIEVFGLFLFVRHGVVGFLRTKSQTNLSFAADIDTLLPRLQDRLASAIGIGKAIVDIPEGAPIGSVPADPRTFSRAMLNALFVDAKRSVSRQVLSRVLFRKRFFILLILFIGGLILAGQTVRWTPYTFSDMINMYLNPLLKSPFTQRALFVVEPGNVEIYPNETVSVKVTLLEEPKSNPTISFRGTKPDWEEAQMSLPKEGQLGKEYTYELRNITRNMDYFANYDGDESSKYKITVVRRPRLSNIETVYTYPAYLGAKTLVGEKGVGDLLAPWGSKVQIRAQFDMELSSVKCELFAAKIDSATSDKADSPDEANAEASKPVPNEALLGAASETLSLRQEGEVWVTDLSIAYTGYYRLTAVERQYAKESEPIIYQMLLKPNVLPQVSLLEPIEDVMGANIRELPLIFTIQDDFGVSKLELAYLIQGESNTKQIRLAEYPYETKIEGQYRWDISPLKSQGKPVVFYLEAYDRIPQENERPPDWRRPDTGRSATRKIFWQQQASMQESSSTMEKPDTISLEAPKTAARRIVRKLSQAEAALDQIKQEARNISQDNKKSKDEKAKSAQELAQRQRAVQKSLNEAKKDAESLAKKSADKRKATTQQKASPAIAKASDSIKSATPGAGPNPKDPKFDPKSANSKVNSASPHIPSVTDPIESLSPAEPGDAPSEEDAVGEAANQVANELGQQEKTITQQQVSVRQGVDQRMDQAQEQLQTGSLDQAASKNEQIQDQLRNMQQRLASAAGIKEELEELRKEQAEAAKPKDMSQGGAGSDKSQKDQKQPGGSAAKGGKQGSKGEGKGKTTEGTGTTGPDARYVLQGTENLSGISNTVENAGGKEKQESLRAFEDEKVPPEYKAVTIKYFELLSSDAKKETTSR